MMRRHVTLVILFAAVMVTLAGCISPKSIVRITPSSSSTRPTPTGRSRYSRSTDDFEGLVIHTATLETDYLEWIYGQQGASHEVLLRVFEMSAVAKLDSEGNPTSYAYGLTFMLADSTAYPSVDEMAFLVDSEVVRLPIDGQPDQYLRSLDGGPYFEWHHEINTVILDELLLSAFGDAEELRVRFYADRGLMFDYTVERVAIAGIEYMMKQFHAEFPDH